MPNVHILRYYENITPVMVVSDVEMIKQFLVKEFTRFNVRKVWTEHNSIVNCIRVDDWTCFIKNDIDSQYFYHKCPDGEYQNAVQTVIREPQR